MNAWNHSEQRIQPRCVIFHRGMFLRSAVLTAAGLSLPLLFFSCAMENKARVVKSPPMVDLRVIERKTDRIAQLEKENAQLGDQLLEQKLLSQKLQTALLKRHRETDTCLQAKGKLATELKQSKAKLAIRGSKLGAVTCVAEAEAVIRSVAKHCLDDSQAVIHERSVRNLSASRRELEKENYAGAFFLCRKAMEQVRGIDLGKGPGNALSDEEDVFFSTPLQMELFITGNLRASPSMRGDIKTVLPAGTRVTAIGFQRNWVRVKSSDPAKTGWVHLSLLY